MVTVYSLRLDKTGIERGQNAVLTTEKFGLVPTYGLFGSDEWWGNIESGAQPIQTISGVISDVYNDERGADWRGFTLVAEDGTASYWECMANVPAYVALYKPGRRVELDYVNENRRSPFNDGSTAMKCLVEIRLGDPN